jgi:phosphopantetheinyl transferase (holo-ACP synthase)
LISIGNDIVDLNKTNPERTKQEKFYSKIICKQELELFNKFNDNDISFENYVWLAWSVKESVYKFYKRNNAEALFSPTKIVIQNIELPEARIALNFGKEQLEETNLRKQKCYRCEIIFDSYVFYSRTYVYKEIIFTVVNNEDCFDDIFWGIKFIEYDDYAYQSKAINDFTLEKMQQIFENKNLKITKHKIGYPEVLEHKQIAVSFTHHGNFVGYAFK